MKPRVLFCIMSHGRPETIWPVFKHWLKAAGEHSVLLVHGGLREDFDAMDTPDKVWTDDSRLRTRSHPMEKQGYCGTWKIVADWIIPRDFDYIYWGEFDELPVVENLDLKLLKALESEKADVLFRNLKRIDGSNDAHWLYHEYEPRYRECFERVSVRENKQVVFSIVGDGSFWIREAFLETAAHPEISPVYNELFMPTMPHHLGFRVRDYGEQSRFISFNPKSDEEIRKEICEGAWTIHPVKGRSEAELSELLKF